MVTLGRFLWKTSDAKCLKPDLGNRRTKPHLYKEDGRWRCRHYTGVIFQSDTPKGAYDYMKSLRCD